MALRIGLIGSGKIAAQFVSAARETGRLIPAAILSRTQDAGQAFAAQNAIPAVYTDESAFFASGLDAVYIATPNYAHARAVRAALDSGLHVLVEKPAVLTEADWLPLAARAKEKGLILFEGMRPLHDPAFAVIRARLPRVGRLREVHLTYCQYSSRYDAFRAGTVLNAFDPSLGNAALMDIGVYPAALAVALFGRPSAVTAASVFLENGFEGCGEALLSYDGFRVTVTYSKITEAVTPSVFLGEDGALLVDGHLGTPARLRFVPRNGTPEDLPYTPAGNNMIHEINVFADLVASGHADHPYLATTAAELALLDAVRASSGIRFPAQKP